MERSGPGEPASGRIWKIDPATNSVVQQQKLHGWLSDLAVGDGSVWAPILPDGVVFKLSEDDLSIQRSLPDRRGSRAGVVREVGASGWRTPLRKSCRSSTTSQVCGSNCAPDARPTTATYHAGLIWAGGGDRADAACRPLRARSSAVSTPTDTAVDPDPMGGKGSVRQLMYATCANLLYYPDSAGPEGTRLRPEIAAAMPTVSPDGRTYTFRIRPGYRFSPPSGEAVTAETFRHTLERSLSPKNVYSAGPQLVSDIEGVRRVPRP